MQKSLQNNAQRKNDPVLRGRNKELRSLALRSDLCKYRRNSAKIDSPRGLNEAHKYGQKKCRLNAILTMKLHSSDTTKNLLLKIKRICFASRRDPRDMLPDNSGLRFLLKFELELIILGSRGIRISH